MTSGAQLTMPVTRRWKWRRSVSIARLAAQRPFGIDTDAWGEDADPVLPEACACKRPAVQVDEDGDRRCAYCGKRARP